MAETIDSLRQTHQPNPASHSLFHVLDPISLILSQNSSPGNPISLRLTTDSSIMERGPRYRAYAELRETKLRMKTGKQQEREKSEFKQTPTKKQVKFRPGLGISRKGGSSVLAQSVPGFSATLRKENRKPVSGGIELTPPGKNSSKGDGVLSNSRGSKSANAGEKGRLMVARKSYATVEELKGISLAAATAIKGENRGGKRSDRDVGGNDDCYGVQTVLEEKNKNKKL